eukprot:7464374-Pyramimonas_sp.AAC.1
MTGNIPCGRPIERRRLRIFSTSRTELAPGNPGRSQRWIRRVFDVCAPECYGTTRLEDASGILHFKSGSEASLVSTLDR